MTKTDDSVRLLPLIAIYNDAISETMLNIELTDYSQDDHATAAAMVMLAFTGFLFQLMKGLPVRPDGKDPVNDEICDALLLEAHRVTRAIKARIAEAN